MLEILGWIAASIACLMIAVGLWPSPEKPRVPKLNPEREDAKASARAKAIGLIETHVETLATRRRILRRTDPYGVVYDSVWVNEVVHFYEKIIKPKMTAEERLTPVFDRPEVTVRQLIEEGIARQEAGRATPASIPDTMTPLEFEALCVARLARTGWEASGTQTSGDQGADVIGVKNGIRLVIQCKLFQGSVGNFAVQEVLGAKAYYGCHVAAVVCASDYTKSARDLARATGVFLIHIDELERFASYAELPAARSVRVSVDDWKTSMRGGVPAVLT